MTLGAEISTKMINIPDQEEAVELVFIDSSGRYKGLLLSIITIRGRSESPKMIYP